MSWWQPFVLSGVLVVGWSLFCPAVGVRCPSPEWLGGLLLWTLLLGAILRAGQG